MILSDRDIRAAIDAGRVVIEPLGPNAIQPSSVDVRIGNRFRVFANNRYAYIDVREPMEDLTELIEVDEEQPFILHPGEFVLGTTLESVDVPNDLVARLEGKSSLARLGLLIHSSLPAGEPVLFLHDGEVRQRPIEEIVRKQLDGCVVSFNPETFEVSWARVTGWYEGPEDRIHEVVLASGRRVRVTAGHNLFTLDRDGNLAKVRTGALRPGTRVAIPRAVPDLSDMAASLDVRRLMPAPATTDTDPGDAARYEGGGRPPAGGPAVATMTRHGRLDVTDLAWDKVVEVRDTGRRETIFDLEVRPGGEPIENFLAGRGGVFVSNTAGFVDAGWSGHLTLELSNVANLPITLYPGMKIGQLAFFQLTSPAQHPYGSAEIGSKYHGQSDPTPSRYHLNFERPDGA